MTTPAPICVACRLEMRCVVNNCLVRDPEVGVRSSTFWVGDEWRCPQCGARIVTGFGRAVTAEEMAPRPDLIAGALQFDYERPASVPAAAVPREEN